MATATDDNAEIKNSDARLFEKSTCWHIRINVTLGIKKSDVDLENGIIKLIETKNDCERYIVLNDGMKHLMRRYADKTFYLIGDQFLRSGTAKPISRLFLVYS